MRTVLAILGAVMLSAACDKEPTKLDAMLEASTLPSSSGPIVPAASSTGTAPSDAGEPPKPVQDASAWDGSMPPRPIAKPAMTVGSGMSADVQMQAIAYMTAMSQPRIDDAPADSAYASGLAAQLRPLLLSFDKGTPEDKARLDRVDVIAGGRRIDLLMAEGCNSELPRAATQRANLPLTTLVGHGVLVVKCNDSHVQCLQSTRDAADILCTTAPRHH